VTVIRAKYTALLFLLPAISAIVNAQTIGSASTCTNASLSGSYGYTLSGWIFTSTGGEYPFADSGTLTSNEKGSLSGTSAFSVDGTIQAPTVTGTYSVNSNCTGTATLKDSGGDVIDLNLVIVDNGQSIQLVESDSGTVVSGNMTSVQTGCTAETINGLYGLALSGWVYDSSGNPYFFTDVGRLDFSGAASTVTLNDTVSAAGTVTTRSLSGSYSLNSNCTGTATLSGGTLHLNFTVVAGAIQLIETDAGTTIAGSANAMGNVVVGGAMAHIAAGDGWQTTFTLINPSASSAQVQLSFFDDAGNALSLPLTYVQTGEKTTASTLTQTIAAGATLVLLTQGSSTTSVTEGSAQLTTTEGAGVNGFAIFANNGQEAVVPLETRNPAAFVLGFDNTSGLATGVALANVADAGGNVGVVLRDDTGAVLDTTTINLGARGHTSFVLSSRYSSTANKRGTVEFDTPAGGQISALGILATPTGAFTTIPVLVK
jgi:hypothetical protein